MRFFIALLSLLATTAATADTWPRLTLPQVLPAPDLSGLNHRPAGHLGHVRAEGDALVYGDGSPARFWGTNLQAYALFRTKPENIAPEAHRIAAMGFNLVRIHHHDSHWVTPNVFGAKSPDTKTLDPGAMSQLDRWIAALKPEGVYVWLDLHTGRKLTPGDGFDGYEELKEGEMRGFAYVSPGIQERMEMFQEAYLGHVNPLTGLSYAEDPAILAVLLTNENDVTHHFGNALLPGKGAPGFSATYMAAAGAFAETHGLDQGQVWKAWLHGTPKIFLNDLEERLFTPLARSLRQTGYPGLLATTSSWGGMSIAGLPALTLGSLIDAHTYGRPGELTRDPREEPSFLDWAAAAQVAGLPLSISEWNLSPFPAEDRFIAPLRMAAMAAHQGWDAPMLYGYAQRPLNGPTRPGNWDSGYDPGLVAMLPAAALLYRQGHVPPARDTYALRLDADTFFDQRITPKTSAALRTLPEQSRLVVEIPEVPALPWLASRKAGAQAVPVSRPGRSYLPDATTRIEADTGAFARDFSRGLFTIDTPQSQVAAGSVTERVTLTDISLRLVTPLAALAVQSLDAAPIATSKEILISLARRAEPLNRKDPVWRVEPIAGELTIHSRPGLTLRGAGPRGLPLPDAVTEENGSYTIDLGKTRGAFWLILD